MGGFSSAHCHVSLHWPLIADARVVREVTLESSYMFKHLETWTHVLNRFVQLFGIAAL